MPGLEPAAEEVFLRPGGLGRYRRKNRDPGQAGPPGSHEKKMAMDREKIDINSSRIDVLEAKIDIILLLTGGQFLGFLAIIITFLTA